MRWPSQPTIGPITLVSIVACLAFGAVFAVMVHLMMRIWHIRKGISKVLWFVLLGLVVVFGAVILTIPGLIGWNDFDFSFIEALKAVVPTAIITFFAVNTRKRSEYGKKSVEAVLGYRDFIDKVEIEKLKRMIDDDPEFYYHVLSYAIVLGLEKKWAKKFDGITLEPPQWYMGRYEMWNAMVLSSMLRCNTALVSSIATMPASQARFGGSSFGGGGFSGRFGGGGGGLGNGPCSGRRFCKREAVLVVAWVLRSSDVLCPTLGGIRKVLGFQGARLSVRPDGCRGGFQAYPLVRPLGFPLVAESHYQPAGRCGVGGHHLFPRDARDQRRCPDHLRAVRHHRVFDGGRPASHPAYRGLADGGSQYRQFAYSDGQSPELVYLFILRDGQRYLFTTMLPLVAVGAVALAASW